MNRDPTALHEKRDVVGSLADILTCTHKIRVKEW